MDNLATMIRVDCLAKRFMIYNRPLDRLVDWLAPARMRRGLPFWALRDTTNEDLAAMYQYIVSLGAAGAPTPDFVPPGQEPKPPYETRRLVQ